MFDFFNEIFNENDLNSEFKIMLTSKKIYMQGFKDFLKLESEEVVLKLKNGEISFKGNNFKVEELNTSSIILTGKIKDINFSGMSYEK